MIELEEHDLGGYFCPADPGEKSTGWKPRVSVTDDEAQLLKQWARGRVVLEIGTGLGVATKAMAASAKRVYTVDFDEWVVYNVWPTLTGLKNVYYYLKAAQAPRADMIFIDANHTTEAIRVDILTADSKLIRPGIVVAHDVKRANILHQLKWLGEVDVTMTAYGLGKVTIA